jgi:Ca2+-binding EF-hand superfamily protein
LGREFEECQLVGFKFEKMSIQENSQQQAVVSSSDLLVEEEKSPLLSPSGRRDSPEHSFPRETPLPSPELLLSEQFPYSGELKYALEQLFDLIDINHDGQVTQDEAFKYSRLFHRRNSQIEKAVQHMFQDVDADNSKTLDRAEWLNYFSRVFSAYKTHQSKRNLNFNDEKAEQELVEFVHAMSERIEISRKEIKWSGEVTKWFFILMFLQITIVTVLLVLQIHDMYRWKLVNTLRDDGVDIPTVNPLTNNPSFRIFVPAFVLGSTIVGLLTVYKEKLVILRVFSVLGMTSFLMSMVLAILDSSSLSSMLDYCRSTCSDMGMTSGGCVCKPELLIRLAQVFDFIMGVLSGIPAIMGLFYSTSLAESQFVNAWGGYFLSWSGVSQVRRTFGKNLWLNEDNEEEL